MNIGQIYETVLGWPSLFSYGPDNLFGVANKFFSTYLAYSMIQRSSLLSRVLLFLGFLERS